MRKAGSEMRKQRLSGRVENLSNSRSFYVKAAQSKSKRTYSRRWLQLGLFSDAQISRMMEVQASFWLGMTANEIEARSWERIDFDYEEPEAKGVTAKFIARNVIWNHLMQGAVNRLGLEIVDTTPTWSTDELAQRCVDRFNL